MEKNVFSLFKKNSLFHFPHANAAANISGHIMVLGDASGRTIAAVDTCRHAFAAGNILVHTILHDLRSIYLALHLSPR